MGRRNSDHDLSADTDTYSVIWDGTTATVKHYLPDTRRACCSVKVTISDQDRAQAEDFEKVKGSSAALHRVYLSIEKKHAHGT